MNPIRIFENLRDMYLRYLDSPFDLRYEDLTNERRELLDRDGRIYRYPLIEPIPNYRTSGESFGKAAQALLGRIWQPNDISDVAAFVNQGLFSPELNLYQHQRDVFEEVVVNRRDTVVTTGTGSGKTECFLLPVIASILKESATWTTPAQRSSQWDWWNHFTPQGKRRRWADRVSQRSHERRPAAIRALLLYPLNALVEDQLTRLREALDSPKARLWLHTNRQGNLVYFGRYTGRTPISGEIHSSNINRLRSELKSIHESAKAVSDKGEEELERYFQSMDGAEMWSRWDMQEAPPDIFITNYSMLNIMLMRSIETSIFEKTRAWLQQSPEHIFHLVVDELHTYRGTPGTEVAYLLRTLFDRLGLSPDSEQLRIISSSASLESGTMGLRYLEQFFGRDRRHFRVIGGIDYVALPDINAKDVLSRYCEPFSQFSRNINSSGMSGLPQAATSLHDAVGAPHLPAGASPENILDVVIKHVKASDALRLACIEKQQIVPQSPSALASTLFSRDSQAQSYLAIDGLLTALSHAQNNVGVCPISMRVHLMFRNLEGLWICTDFDCKQVPERSPSRPAGVLHYVPTLTCQCGARVLELLDCESCGEVFFGGYRRKAENPNEWYLSPDHPDLEASSDLASFDRDYDHYAVFWPTKGVLKPTHSQWIQGGIVRKWRDAHLDPVDGRVSLGRSHQPARSGYLYCVSSDRGRKNSPPTDVAQGAYPARCPRCDADLAGRKKSAHRFGRSEQGFRKSRRFFRMAYYVTSLNRRFPQSVSWSYFPIVAKMQQSSQQECVFLIIKTLCVKHLWWHSNSKVSDRKHLRIGVGVSLYRKNNSRLRRYFKRNIRNMQQSSQWQPIQRQQTRFQGMILRSRIDRPPKVFYCVHPMVLSVLLK